MGFPKLVKCVDTSDGAEFSGIVVGRVYTAIEEDDEYIYLEKDDADNIRAGYLPYRFEDVDVGIDVQPAQKAIDSHYSGFTYNLTQFDIDLGVIKVDPYFVSKQWGLGKKDDTGVLFHCLKNISRYSDKNTKEREIKALYLQVKRLAELENVDLEDGYEKGTP